MVRNFTLASCLALAILPADAVAAGIEIVELSTSPIRLLQPAADLDWISGGEIELAWEPVTEEALPEGAHEWEAFLSVDGGRTFPVRLTPHLEIELRRVRVRVPDLPSSDVRLLFRVGDEREERATLLPQQFRIARGAGVQRHETPTPGSSFSRGESALANAVEVVFWAEGEADGSRWEERSGRRAATLDSGDAGLSDTFDPDFAAESEDHDSVIAPAADAGERAPSPAIGLPGSRSSAPARTQDLLLLLSRRNE